MPRAPDRPTETLSPVRPTGVGFQNKGFTVNQRRTLILIAAIVIGALSSFLVWNYVNGVQDEAYSNAERVPVYLVKTAIPRGTPGLDAAAYISKEDIPRKFKPANAITSMEDITNKVALNNLVPNQVVVSDMFVSADDPNARASFTDGLNRVRGEDQVAISITVDQVRGVAGLIQPGDFVNIMVYSSANSGGADGSKGAASSTAGVLPRDARYLYQKAEVIAVGTQTLPQPGQSAQAASASGGDGEAAAPAQNTGLITLVVPAKAAQYIASAPPDAMYLTLVARDYKPVPIPDLGTNPPLPGESADMLTPYGPKGPESGK